MVVVVWRVFLVLLWVLGFGFCLFVFPSTKIRDFPVCHSNILNQSGMLPG